MTWTETSTKVEVFGVVCRRIGSRVCDGPGFSLAGHHAPLAFLDRARLIRLKWAWYALSAIFERVA